MYSFAPKNITGRKAGSGGDATTDMFLGHLCPVDEYRVYGYMTTTRLKLLAVLEDVNDIREPDLKRVGDDFEGVGLGGVLICFLA